MQMEAQKEHERQTHNWKRKMHCVRRHRKGGRKQKKKMKMKMEHDQQHAREPWLTDLTDTSLLTNEHAPEKKS